MKPRKPNVEVYGPAAIHDMVCAVCQQNHAVLDLSVGHYLPCWRCQRDGYMLVRPPKLLRGLARRWAR